MPPKVTKMTFPLTANFNRPTILIAIFLAITLLRLNSAQINAQRILQADFTVDYYSIDVDCNSNYLLTKWLNLTETNVAGFKVHLQSVDINSGEIKNRWVNPIAVVAKGAGQEYTVIDSAIKPNAHHTFRIYGFEKNNLLSKAKQVVLTDQFVLYCTRLPLTII